MQVCMGELSITVSLNSSDLSLDYGFEKMYEELGEPDCFYIDFKPFHFLPSMLVVTSPFVAEQITRPSAKFPTAAPKSWTVKVSVKTISKEFQYLLTLPGRT